MRKNLRACVEQPVYGESQCLIDMSDPRVGSAGMPADPVRSRTAVWRFGSAKRVRIPTDLYDLSAFRFLTFSAWAVSGAGGAFSLFLESGSQAEGQSGYLCTLPVTRNGWNDYRIELPFPAAVGNPAGWDRIGAVVFDCAASGQKNRAETVLSVGNLTLWNGLAPYLYARRPELKGAAVFSKTGSYAIVDRKRVSIAPDADLSVKPFERDGELWVPMAPIAAVLGHKAVADNKTETLNFIYRRKKYAFSAARASYVADGETVPMNTRPASVGGTLFFPAEFVRSFFRWRQRFADVTGLVIFSNRKNIFDRSLESPFLWNLCAEVTLPHPSGRDVLDDLRRKSPNASRGRLIRTHEEWMSLRRVLKENAVPADRLKAFKEVYGKSSDAFRASPVFADSAEPTAERFAQASERIAAFAALYRITGEKPYAERVATEGDALAALPAWNAENDPVGAASAALGMSLGYDWCRFAWSEARKMKWERAILRHAMRPWLDAETGKGKAWRSDRSEAPQIHAGALAAALALADAYPETSRRILDRVLSALAKCFAAYSPDGGYPEGVTAWEKATRALVLSLAMAQSACGKTYGLDALSGFAATAYFPLMATTKNGGWKTNGRETDLSFLPWFAEHYGMPLPAIDRPQDAESGRACPTVWDLIFGAGGETDAGKPALPLDAVWRRAGLVALRSDWGGEATFLSIHGGSNAFNGLADAGSFLLESEGERFFTESDPIGAYNIFSVEPSPETAQSQTANAALLAVRGSTDRAYTVVDTTETDPKILRGKRGALLTDRRRVAVIQDELTLAEPATVQWTAYTPAKVEVLRTRYAILEKNGKRLLCRISGAAGKWEAEPVAGTDLTRLTVRVAANGKMRLAVACRAYREGDDRKTPFYDLRPIGAWDRMDPSEAKT